MTYEVLKEFENVINTQLGTKALKVHVAFIPVTRDQLQPALEEGRGDIAAANLTSTTQIESVEFSDPLMNAGLIGITVVKSHVAEFWAKVFDSIKVHNDLALHTGGEIAWAFRKDSPKHAAVINAFVKDHKLGTSFGNQMLNRYLKNIKYVKNSTTEEEMKKFRAMVALFQRYAREYDFDYLMLGAQGFQESRLDQSVRSPAGAVGVMHQTEHGGRPDRRDKGCRDQCR